MERLNIVLLLILLQFLCGGQAAAQCKDIGQYCTAHTDCCSTSCLSFSYKCVERHQEPEQLNETVASTTEPIVAASTISDIDKLAERFDGDDATTNTYQTRPNEMPSTMLPIQTDQPVSQTSNEIGHNDSNCRSNGSLCMNSNQCCSNFCSKITNLCIVPTPDSLSTEQMTLTRPAVLSNKPEVTCYDIGHKCYATANVECCPPLRCHGYLHKCVT
ncbi:uncharacterized protein LOC116346853 [Contarinia nasturtii]|uniref:uncharacterized protein LOC116346853 n=1 Tax=Contarinia nasturtii TaxID=265458 RepID=UPI0012D4A086|nr:uncharacterized protein LOC116346853 [Contarinia nasturtii]